MNREAFFAAVRHAPFSGALSRTQVNGIIAILDEWDRRVVRAPGLLIRGSAGAPHDEAPIGWLAYMLATTFHETARTMQPIREYGRGRGMRYGTTYYGRGFVQLTWETNYRKASAVVGVDLVADPDRALELPIAAAILFDGMLTGWFTGKKLADFIHDGVCNYRDARRIINGTDRAETIAGYAVSFERALQAAESALSTDPLPPALPVPLPRFAGKGAAPPPPPGPPDDPGVEPNLPEPAASGGFFHALLALLTALFTKGKQMTKIDPMGALMGAALHANPVASLIGTIVADTLARPDVPLAKEHVGAVAAKVVDAVAAQAEAGGLTLVPIKSGWASKINWVQLAGPACSLLAAFGLNLAPDQLVGFVVAVQSVQSVVTWILRTWFTHAMTQSSVR